MTISTSPSKPVLSLGPVYYLWDGPKWRDFYFRIADEAPIAHVTIGEAADEVAKRLTRIFLKDDAGERPVFRHHPRLQGEHFRDHLLFFEYFHGDLGRGVGASHQTGWTGLIAKLLMPRHRKP